MSDHTLAPWHVINEPKYHFTIVDVDGTVISTISYTKKGDFARMVSEPNAHLIAAAPELLEALELATKYMPHAIYIKLLKSNKLLGEILVAAIAKAKGE